MSPRPHGSSAGRIGLLGAVSIGVGGMVGGGIFAVLGEAVTLAHGATAIAFLVAGVVALLTSYSYAHLSVRYPSQGGTVVFVHHAFGTDLATGTVNLILWLSYLVTLSLYAVAFGDYALTFFSGTHSPWLPHVLISAGIVVPVALNLLNAEIVSRSETLVVCMKLALLAIVVAAGIGYIQPVRLRPATWSSPLDVFASGMVIFVAYEGFELIANAAEDVRDPAVTLPRAFFGSVLLVIALYVLVAVVTVGTVPADQIARVKDYALAEAARPALGAVGFEMVAVAALLATLSAINATVYGNARLGYTLAVDGELPEILEDRAWNEPAAGVLIVGGLALLMANTIDLTEIAIISSAGFLLVFAVVNAAAVVLGHDTGARRWISATGCATSLVALITLLAHTYADDPHALWVFLAFCGFSLAFELLYPRLRERELKLEGRRPR
jgi:amino acid transporter